MRISGRLLPATGQLGCRLPAQARHCDLPSTPPCATAHPEVALPHNGTHRVRRPCSTHFGDTWQGCLQDLGLVSATEAGRWPQLDQRRHICTCALTRTYAPPQLSKAGRSSQRSQLASWIRERPHPRAAVYACNGMRGSMLLRNVYKYFCSP